MKKLFLSLLLCLSFFTYGNVKDTIDVSKVSIDNFEKTDDVLSVILNKALIGAEKTGEFVIEQAPLVLQEFYNWHIMSDILMIIVGIVLIILSRYVPYLWVAKDGDTDYYRGTYFGRKGDQDYIFPAWLVFGIGSIVGIINICINIYDLVYILTAPKIYLIDYFLS